MIARTEIEGFGRVRQLGHVVADIDEAMQEWVGQGVGPWMVMRRVHLNAVYKGQPSVPVIDVALAYKGDVQIELIRQHNTAPSPYLATIEQGSYGLHHLACLCDVIDADVDAALERGLQMVCDIHMMGSRYVYLFDAERDEYVELLPNSLMMRGMFAQGMRATRRWNKASAIPKQIDIDMSNALSLITSLPRAGRGWFSQQLGV